MVEIPTEGVELSNNPLPDYIRMYYEHQYNRMEALESQRLTLTNVVITVSIVVFTFGFKDSQKLTLLEGVGLPPVMFLANLFAIGYIWRSARFIWVHDHRAKRILEQYASELYELDKSLPWPGRLPLTGRTTLQILLHVLLSVAALLPMLVYYFQ